MAALVHITRKPFGPSASAAVIPCGMGADGLAGAFPLTTRVLRARNGENPALDVRRMR